MYPFMFIKLKKGRRKKYRFPEPELRTIMFLLSEEGVKISQARFRFDREGLYN